MFNRKEVKELQAKISQLEYDNERLTCNNMMLAKANKEFILREAADADTIMGMSKAFLKEHKTVQTISRNFDRLNTKYLALKKSLERNRDKKTGRFVKKQ